MSARIESLLDELDHLRIQISLAREDTDRGRLCALELRSVHAEKRVQQEQRNPNTWKAGDKPRN